jgi:type IV pilus assembly protein PilP
MKMKYAYSIVVLVLALAGCGNEAQTELTQWMQEESKSMRGKVPPLPELTPFPAVAYDGVKLIVPFSQQKIVIVEPATDLSSPDSDRQRQPLESFALEDLRVTGIIVQDGVSYALVTPPLPNKPKQVRVGEYMGKNFGRVTAITTDELRVLEATKDNNGVWVEREVVKPVPRNGDKK